MNNSPCDTCIHWHQLCWLSDSMAKILVMAWPYCDENKDGTIALDHCPVGGYESRE